MISLEIFRLYVENVQQQEMDCCSSNYIVHGSSSFFLILLIVFVYMYNIWKFFPPWPAQYNVRKYVVIPSSFNIPRTSYENCFQYANIPLTELIKENALSLYTNLSIVSMNFV